jgi:anti-sigma B factor antagonist
VPGVHLRQSVSLQIEISRIEAEVVLVKLSGNMTRWDERFMDEQFMYDLLQRAEQKLIVDLFGVNQIDSSGTQVLYAWFSAVRKAGGEIRFVGANARVLRLLQVTRLDTLLKFCSSIHHAAETFSPPAHA